MAVRTDFDVIVVGAGPAGGMAALTAAELGLRTALVEEHPAVGTPAHCSGKLQVHAFREFNLPESLILNTLQAGAFYAPNGVVARVRRAVPDSHVVDRAEFDRWLARQAQERGAELLLDTRLRAAEPPVIAGVEEGRVLLDLRTVFPEQEELVAQALAGVAG